MARRLRSTSRETRSPWNNALIHIRMERALKAEAIAHSTELGLGVSAWIRTLVIRALRDATGRAARKSARKK